MYMQKLMDAVCGVIDAGEIPVLLGPDGEGKTSFVLGLIKQRGWGGWILNGSNMDPTDIGGAISVDANGNVSRVPVHRCIREAVEYAEAKKLYVILIDELTSAPKAVRATILTLASEYIAGDVQLDREFVHIIMAANPPSIAVNGTQLAPPVCTRMVHFDWKLDFDFWAEKMVAGEFAPVDASSLVVAYLKDCGEYGGEGTSGATSPAGVWRVPPTKDWAGKARPTPRTWTRVAKLVDSFGLENLGVLSLAVRGAIGDGVGTEFIGFLRLREEIGNPEDILAAADTWDIPARGDLAYMFYSAIAIYTRGKPTEKNWRACWKLIGRAEERGHKDKAQVAASSLISILQTPAGSHLRKTLVGPKKIPELLSFAEMFQDLGKLKKTLSE